MTTNPPSSDRYSPAEFFVLRHPTEPESWVRRVTLTNTEASISWTEDLKEAARHTEQQGRRVRLLLKLNYRGAMPKSESFDRANVRTVRLHAKP